MDFDREGLTGLCKGKEVSHSKSQKGFGGRPTEDFGVWKDLWSGTNKGGGAVLIYKCNLIALHRLAFMFCPSLLSIQNLRATTSSKPLKPSLFLRLPGYGTGLGSSTAPRG